jgi:hypothetical protein
VTGKLWRMKTLATLAAAPIALAITIGGIATASAPHHQPDLAGTGRLKQCPPPWHFLDPQVGGCVWDGAHHHDGSLPARSFMVTPAGRVIFLPHYAAHVLLYGGGDSTPEPTATVTP